MKLQLFINGYLHKELGITDKRLCSTKVHDQEKSDLRKGIIDWYTDHLKTKYLTEIHNAMHYEIILCIESKMNKPDKRVQVIEKPIKKENKPIPMIRPESVYSNKGYLSLTGS